MKSYDEFMDYVKENVTDYLPERFENAQIRIQQVTKNNDVVLDALTIIDPASRLSPNIYLNPMYEQYKDGKDLDEMVAKIADAYVENMAPDFARGFDVSVDDFTKYEKIKDHIFPRVANLERNSKRLETVPYTQKEDLAITYHIKVASDGEGVGSVMITNYLMEQYGVSKEELHKVAMGNMERLSPTVFTPLKEIMMDIMAGDIARDEGISPEEAREYAEDDIPTEGPELYCLTNEEKINGAAYIMNEDIQKMVAEKVGGDFFVIPSSVHEVLIMGKDEEISVQELRNMVQFVNGSCVSPDEVLSDQVYEYNAKAHKFSICAPEKELKQEKAMGMGMNPEPAFVMEDRGMYHTNQPEQNHEPMKHSVRGR